MHPLIRVYLMGLLVSFLGSLPMGTLNVAAMQISVSDGVLSAMQFSLGSLLVEAVYVRLSLVAMDWVRKQEKIFRILEWVTLAIVVVLAIASFYAAMHPSVQKNVFLSSTLPFVVMGATMCAVSPGQIPFWFAWSTVLFTKKILLPKNSYYNTYILGIALGTFGGNCVFIFGGQLVADKLNHRQDIVNWVIGSIFAATALFQLWKIVKKKTALQKTTASP
jgi:threonine/homoserine/homoserine lactone efflux protein